MKLESIHNVLYTSDISPILIKWIGTTEKRRMIKSRLERVSLGKQSVEGHHKEEFSLFLLLGLINEIPVSIKAVAYAEDVVVLISGRFFPTIYAMVENGLEVNPAKSGYVLLYYYINFRF